MRVLSVAALAMVLAQPAFADGWMRTPLVGAKPDRTFLAIDTAPPKNNDGTYEITVVDYFETQQQDHAVKVFTSGSLNCKTGQVAITLIQRYADNGGVASTKQIEDGFKPVAPASPLDTARKLICDGDKTGLTGFTFNYSKKVGVVFGEEEKR